MKNFRIRFSSLLILTMIFGFAGTAMGQTIIAEQDFDSETSWGYSSSVTFFDDGWGTAYLGIIDIGSASPLDKAEFSLNILGENDLNSTNGTGGFANITFSEIDITSYSNVEITFDYQVKGYNATDDDAKYEVFHDGVGQEKVDLHDGASDPDDSEGSITIAVPNSVDAVELVISIRNNGQTGYSGFDNFKLAESSIKSEPTNHASSFSATSTSIEKVDLSWTDASSGTLPDTYLILANDDNSFTTPSDGTAQSDDTDLSDGSGILNVSQGTQSASFSGLDPNTQYYFEIYPYTNTGSNVDYKTDGTAPSDSATTLAAPDLVLNEILANPPSNANGDETYSTDEDEFLEFVNTGNSNLDISGWKIEDSQFVRYTFPSETILKPYQAIVIFDDGTPKGDFGGAIVKTAGELNLNNSDEQLTVKDDEDNILIQITYPYSGAESIVRNPDLTGGFADHSTADTSLFSPGTRIDGSTFQPSVSITGSEGWRILASPTASNSYDDLLGDLWTQGIATGADAATGTANVQTYNGSEFSGISDMGATMTSGHGFIVYVYSDDDYTESGADAGFPKTLEMFAVPTSGSVSPTLTSGANAWTLVGNPYYSGIGWDEVFSNTGTENITSTVYVYDHSYGSPVSPDVADTGSVGGAYRTWNGNAGSLEDGRISSFQGFWVQNASSGTPSLTIEEADKISTDTTLFKQAQNESITLKLRGEMDNMFSEAFLSFTENGLVEKDNYDGLKLSPLDFRTHLSVASVIGDTKLDINNLPTEFDNDLVIPVSVQAFTPDMENGTWVTMGGEVILSWPAMKNIPEDWNVVLNDLESGAAVDMKAADSYVFELPENQQAKAGPALSVLNPQPPQVERLAKSTENSRFTVTISKSTTTNTEPTDAPKSFTLEQNYPNPFNPTTSIQYSVAEAGDVSLTIYNVMGQKVETLVNGTKAAGTYRISWDAANMASGIYYYSLHAGNQVLTRQMTLIK